MVRISAIVVFQAQGLLAPVEVDWNDFSAGDEMENAKKYRLLHRECIRVNGWAFTTIRSVKQYI